MSGQGAREWGRPWPVGNLYKVFNRRPDPSRQRAPGFRHSLPVMPSDCNKRLISFDFYA